MLTEGITDRQTGMTKLVVSFRNFTNTPNKENAILRSGFKCPMLKARGTLL
jgi:hypothetical protein